MRVTQRGHTTGALRASWSLEYFTRRWALAQRSLVSDARSSAFPMVRCPLRVLTRSYAVGSPSMVRRMEINMNPATPAYSMEHAYEEPTLRFICEGADIDFKKEVREALLKLLPPSAGNFTAQTGATSDVARLFRALCARRLVSFAQVRSTPQRLASFFETLATADPALAALAADHFTAAGMLATHAGERSTPSSSSSSSSPSSLTVMAALDGADAGRCIGCVARRELIAEGVPYNTEARYDAQEKCFVLRGTGKFAVVAAVHADWALVTATLTMRKQENHGAHLFYVPLRDSAGGAWRKGVSVRAMGPAGSGLLETAGTAVVHFEDVRLPADSLLRPYRILTDEGRLDYAEGYEATSEAATAVLRDRERLATGAIYVGVMKKLLTDVVHYTAGRDVVGPDHRRNYPYLGVQHVQTPLVSLVAKCFVYLTAWQRLQLAFTGEGAKPPSYEDHMRLAGTVFFLQESLVDLSAFAHQFMGVHAALACNGVARAMATVHLRQETDDRTALVREVAFKSVTKSIGTTHWGWWVTSLLQSIPALDRFVKNPLYSPRIAELGRHLLFFSHKHFGLKKRLRRSRELERRRGGSEHQWYDWTMFRHKDVVLCGEAFMEMYYVEVMMAETQACQDPRGRKILRDIGWIYALARQTDRLDEILTGRMMSVHKAGILFSHLDNLVTVLAPQCTNLVDAMQVPLRFRAPCSAETLEGFWTIPGTNTHIQRGDRMTLHDAAAQQERQQQRERRADGRAEGPEAKAAQEAVRESPDDFDLFHGLADQPSHAANKATQRSP